MAKEDRGFARWIGTSSAISRVKVARLRIRRVRRTSGRRMKRREAGRKGGVASHRRKVEGGSNGAGPVAFTSPDDQMIDREPM